MDTNSIVCPFCGNVNRADEANCVRCGLNLAAAQEISRETKQNEETPAEPVLEPVVAAQPVEEEPGSSKYLVYLLIVIAAIVGLVWMINRDPEPKKDEASATLAYYMCQEFAKDYLKSPSTAEYPRQFDSTKANNNFTIVSYVDAQNGFGAMVRSSMSCSIRYLGNDKWQLIDLNFTER